MGTGVPDARVPYCRCALRLQARPIETPRLALQAVVRVSDPKLHKQNARKVQNVYHAVREHERESDVVVGSYYSFAQPPAMPQHLLGTCLQQLAVSIQSKR